MFDRELFDDARKEFLSHLLYAKGHSKTADPEQFLPFHLTSP